jgi:hypothetical protein
MLLVLASFGLVTLGKSHAAGGWPAVEGVLMITAALSCFACGLSFIRMAIFRCPRCHQAFFRGLASGNHLYALATTCRNCGLPMPGRDAS